MLDVTIPNRGSNSLEYHRIVIKAKVIEQIGFSFIHNIHSIYIEV